MFAMKIDHLTIAYNRIYIGCTQVVDQVRSFIDDGMRAGTVLPQEHQIG